MTTSRTMVGDYEVEKVTHNSGRSCHYYSYRHPTAKYFIHLGDPWIGRTPPLKTLIATIELSIKNHVVRPAWTYRLTFDEFKRYLAAYSVREQGLNTFDSISHLPEPDWNSYIPVAEANLQAGDHIELVTGLNYLGEIIVEGTITSITVGVDDYTQFKTIEVTLMTSDGKLRTFKRADANTIRYNHKLISVA